MRPLKNFEDFLEEGVVTKISPNFSRASDLIKDSEKAYISLKEIMDKIGINENNANTIIKLSYDVLMNVIRAKMLLKGFNATGHGAHEAEVSYLRELKFNEKDVQFCDQLRYFRNGIMYYGKEINKEYVEKVLDFLEEIYTKLKNI